MVPIQCEYYALEGLSQLINTVRQVRRLYNPALDTEGVLLTMYDGRLNLTQQVVDEVKRFSKIRYMPRRFRAMCACPRRPALANLSCTTTAVHAGARPTTNLRRNSLRGTALSKTVRREQDGN